MQLILYNCSINIAVKISKLLIACDGQTTHPIPCTGNHSHICILNRRPASVIENVSFPLQKR